MQLLWLFFWCSFWCYSQGFDFRQVQTTATITTINILSNYSFRFDRAVNNLFVQTNYLSQAVSTNATVTITFPSQYSITSNVSCISISVNDIAVSGFTCNVNGNTVVFGNVFTNVVNLYVSKVVAVVGNVLNPVPAIRTGGFGGTIGSDVAVNANTGVQLTAGTFSSCSITFSPNYVYYSSTTMIVSLTPTNSLTTGNTLRVQFPSNSWSNDISSQTLPISGSMACSNRSTNINNGINCVGSSGNTLITMSNIFPNTVSTSFAIGVNNFLSPPSNQPSDAIVITSFSGSNRVDTCTVYPSDLIPNSFYNFSITPITTMTVNSQVALRFYTLLTVPINYNDYFSIQFPIGTTFTFNQVYGTSFYALPPTISGQTVQIRHDSSVTTTFAQNSAYIITVQYFTAPPSTQPTQPVVFSVLRNGYPIMTGSAALTAVKDTLNGSVTMTNTQVNSNTSYTFQINLKNQLSSASMIRIQFPPSITISTTSTQCASLSGQSVASSPTCTFPSSSSIIFKDLNSSSTDITVQTLTLTVNGLINPADTSTSGTFTVTTYYGSSLNGVTDQGSIAGVVATAGTIDIATVRVIPSSYRVYDTGVTYTISFNNTYTIPVGGSIVITIPTSISINTANLPSYTKYSLNSGPMISTSNTYTQTTSLYIITFNNIAPSNPIAPNMLISLQLTTLCTNPSNTRIIAPFSITTRSNNNANIETVTGFTLQMIEPAVFYTIDLSRDSQMNSALTNYSITLKQQAALPIGTLLFITLPQNITLTPNSLCLDLNQNPLNCTPTSYQTVIVTLNAPVATGTSFGTILTNIRNPPSYRPLSSNFTFQTKTADQISVYARQQQTGSFSNSVPSVFANLSYSFTPGAYLSSQTLTITLTPSTYATPTYILISLAASLSPTVLSCHSFVGFTGGCNLATASLTTLNLTGISGTSSISFTISGFTSPNTIPSDYTTLSSYQNSFMIDQSANTILFNLSCNLPCRTCLASNRSSCLSCYNNTNISVSNLFLSPQCLSICPERYYASGLVCLQCSVTCLTCAVNNANCTSCNISSIYPALNITTGQCLSSCPSYYYLSTALTPAQCTLCDNTTYHCSTCTNLTKCTTCQPGYYLTPSFSCSSTCPSNTTIPNNSTWICQVCSSQCATCMGMVGNCTSCAADAAFYQGQCLNTCPYPLVVNAGTCAGCDSSCKTCSMVSTNCTACYTNSSLPYLTTTNSSLGSCTNLCAYPYYGDLSNGLCQLCSAVVPGLNCRNCSSPTSCLSCDNGYIFHLNTCSLTAPYGYYNNSGLAAKCDINCATCSLLSTNCTACIGNLSLQGSTCVFTCNNGTVGINNTCTTCSVAEYCLACSITTTFCTACVATTPQRYLSTGGRCVTACPNYTYPDASSSTCRGCLVQSHCQLCISAYSCSSCISNYYLHNQTCWLTCPSSQYIAINRICQPCQSPCHTCTNTTSICTSCINDYYLYSTTAPTCVSDCAVYSLFRNNNTGKCSGCQSPCVTCGDYASQCTQCNNSMLLQGSSCLYNCTTGYYPLGNICTQCPQNCTTCVSALICTGCINTHSLYLTQCVTQCPTSHPIVNINNVCSICSNIYCVNCNASNYCMQCYYPQVLIQGSCVGQCPNDYVLDNSGTQCIYSPGSSSSANTTLVQSLAGASSTFPVPFTVAAGFITVACLMSKFQHAPTFILGALYALCGLLQWAALAFLTIYYYTLDHPIVTLSYLLILGGLAGIYLLNLLFLPIQYCSLRDDRRLQSWLHGTFNYCWYYALFWAGLFTTNKIKNMLFCKLFAFQIFSAKLQSVHQLKSFYAFGFLAFIPAIAVLAGTCMLIYQTRIGYDQLFMAQIDVIVLTVLGLILAICHTRKEQMYFQQYDQDGVCINKRVNALDQILNCDVQPSYQEDAPRSYLEKHQSARKFNIKANNLDTLSFYEQSQRSIRDVSIQAEQILGQRSMISRMGTQNLSQFSMFGEGHRDVSLQMDEVKEMVDMSVGEEVRMHDVSIEQTVREQNEASIQYSRANQQISVQYDRIDQHQISIQHVPLYEDKTIHMSRQQQQLSIQCNPIQHSASIQYQARPIIQQLEDSLPGDTSLNLTKEQEPSDLDLQRRMLQGTTAPIEEGLRPELEIDIQEKLERKQRELEEIQRERWEREKEEARLQFQHRIQQRQQLQRPQQTPQPQNRNDNIFNNNTEEAPSSLMHTQEMISIHLPPRPPRPPTAQSEQQFINMLSGDKTSSQPNNSGSSSFSKGRKVHIEGNHDNALPLNQTDNFYEDQQIAPQQGLAQNSIEQFPSADKSRSTANMTGRIGRGGPILQDSQISLNLSQKQEQEQINGRPMEYRPERKLFRQEEVQYAKKTNLGQFLQKKRPQMSSAHHNNRRPHIVQDDDALVRQIQQRPLPPQRSQQVFNQRPSTHSNAPKRKRSIQEQKLQFDNNDHVYIPDDGQLEDALEVQAKKTLSRKGSQKKINSRDTLIERPTGTRGYMRQTFTSQQKRKSLQKIYLNKMNKR